MTHERTSEIARSPVAKDPYTRLVSSFLFPLHERLKKHHSVALRKEMECSQWWPRERLQTFQGERLKAFMQDIARHVPYYRKLFSGLNVDPSAMDSVNKLSALPFLTKSIIREQGEALKADDARALSRFNTGGSTGEPLIFYIGKERVSHDVAAKWRATRWWGVDIGDPEIVVWGSPIELGAQDRLRNLRDRLFRTRLIPAFEFSSKNLDRFVDEIRRFRPRMLFGYPSSLALIARHAESKGISMHDLGIRVAFVTSERLYEDQKSDIERIFACPVANGYGGRDAGFIAHQCPQGGMHITAEDIIVEIVDQEGNPLPPGQAGEVVITHMATRDFPFVRYRTGDVAVLDDADCPCGRGLPLLKEIQGRTTDFIMASDGTLMHGLALIYAVRDVPGVSLFKIIQESRKRTRILVVPDDKFDEQSKNRIKQDAEARLGKEAEVTIEVVEDIPREKSGKYRYVVSHAS